MTENGFWKVCEALDCEQRIELLRILISGEKTEFPSANELAERMDLSRATVSVHLKKLALAGLVSSKRADGRVYYRAFPTTDDGARQIPLRTFCRGRGGMCGMKIERRMFLGGAIAAAFVPGNGIDVEQCVC